MENKRNTNRLKQCPKFIKCSAPSCPLDEFINERVRIKGDPICSMEKSVRLRIGKDMPSKGLTNRETGAARKMKNTTTEEMLKRLRGVRVRGHK